MWYKGLVKICLVLLLFISKSISAQGYADSLKKGEQLFLKEDYLSAFSFFLKLTTELEVQKPKSSVLGYAYMHLANCYEYFDYEKDALAYLHKSLGIFEQQHDKEGLAYVLAYQGDILEDQGRTEEAFVGFKKSLVYFSELKQDKGLAMVYDNIASVYESTQNYDTSRAYLEKAYKISESIRDTFFMAKVLNNLGDVHRRWGKLEQSLAYYHQALRWAELLHSNDLQRSNLKDISKTYYELGYYKEAYQSFDQFYEAHKKLKIEKKIDEITRLQVENNSQQKNLEIQALEAEKQIINLKLIIAGSVLALLVVICVLLFIGHRIKTKKNQELAKVQTNLLKTELKASRLEKDNLEKELELRLKKLKHYTTVLIEKNETMEQLKKKLNESLEREDIRKSSRNRMLEELTSATILTDDDWKQFKTRFEDVYGGFFTKLKTEYPDLSFGDIRLAAVMKLQLSPREIASMMGISEDSVKKAKQRLRNKISADPSFKLKAWVEGL